MAKKKSGATFADVTGQITRTFSTNDAGVYRLAVYTTATAGCPMYSNEIVLVKNNGCVDTPKPVAVNDTYSIPEDTQLTANILQNDSPSSLGGAITVTSFVIDGVTYPSGSTAQVYKNGVLAGVVSISQSGSLTFKSVPGMTLPQVMPDITYNISESGAGQAQAIVRITVTAKPVVTKVVADASCTQCPIKVTMSGSNLLPGSAYSLYRNNTKKGTFDEAYQVIFTEDVSGELTYVVKDGSGTTVGSVIVNVHPSVAKWKTVATNDSWSNVNNWESTTGGGYPVWCTDVTLPSGANIYPTLVANDACRDILFKTGAALGQVQHLLYRKAYVELLLDRNRWYMLGAPLRYMYSADYHGDMTWTNSMSPKIFMMYFNVASNTNPDGRVGYRVGNFSAPFARLEEKVGAGSAFALWLNGKDIEYNYPDQNFPTGTPYKFPRRLSNGSDVSYSYHDAKSGEWLYPSDPLGRGAVSSIPDSLAWVANHDNLSAAQKNNRFRFAFEENISAGSVPVAIKPGATNVVGNPFLSYLDFDKFYADNSDQIYGYYRIWDGVKFYSYITAGASELWSGLSGLTTDASSSAVSRYIAPMQSFFVESKAGAVSLAFKPLNVSTGGVSTSAVLRASAADPVNVVRLNLTLATDQSQAIVALRAGASSSYKNGEDIEKLFSPGGQIAELYTLTSDFTASEINILGIDSDIQDVELGIKTEKLGAGSIDVKGIDQLDIYEKVLLVDKLLNKEYDLRKTASVPFEKTSTANLEKRFYLHFEKKVVSGMEDEIVSPQNSLLLKKERDKYTLVSKGSPILHVLVYDVLGRLVDEKSNPDVFDVDIESRALEKGIYLIKVKTAGAESIFKIVM